MGVRHRPWTVARNVCVGVWRWAGRAGGIQIALAVLSYSGGLFRPFPSLAELIQGSRVGGWRVQSFDSTS